MTPASTVFVVRGKSIGCQELHTAPQTRGMMDSYPWAQEAELSPRWKVKQ